jgi:hypothetical protein
MIEIKLKRKNKYYSCFFDNEDWLLIKDLKPYLVKQGTNGLRVYCNKVKNYAHRIIMNCPKGLTVDHIDNNPLNNAKSNLRICTQKQNAKSQLMPKNNTSGYKGVCFDNWSFKNNLKRCWIARIKVERKNINLGRFLTKEQAAIAYNNAAVKYFGKFAKLNKGI